MVRWRRIGLVLGLAAMAAGSASAQDLSSRERRALSAREADKVARRDLLSILLPTGKNERGMLRRMGGTTFLTRPYATSFRGLCRQDMLTLLYGATASDDRYEDAPLRPYAVEARPVYRVASRTFDAAPRSEKFGREPFDSGCASISDKDDWFFAEDDLLAATGVMVAQAADKRLVDGTLEPSCKDTTPCVDLARQVLAPQDMGNVDTCPAPDGERCFDIGNGTVTIRVKGSGELPIDPATIKSIEVAQVIVVT